MVETVAQQPKEAAERVQIPTGSDTRWPYGGWMPERSVPTYLAAACAHAQTCGATPAAEQPQEDVRVYLDPDGHPFCLWLDA
jgi:hypothetical protein